jgi:hypothetical protein
VITIQKTLVSPNEASIQTLISAISYSAQIFIPLDEETLAIVRSGKKKLTQIAEELFFKKIESPTDKKTSFIKANPLYRMIIMFEDKGVFLKAETTNPNILKYFTRLALSELLAILSGVRKVSMKETKKNYIS